MRRTTAEIQQVEAARLTWVDTNNRKETIFKPPDCALLRKTQIRGHHEADLSNDMSICRDRYMAIKSSPILYQHVNRHISR